MSLSLYMDHNVHGGIVQGVLGRGVDCVTAGEDGMAVADDEAILRRAGELGRVVFTQDVDFLELDCSRMEPGLRRRRGASLRRRAS